MNDNPIIGFYALNDELLPVYFDPISQEVYYVDEQDGAYLLTGFDMETANPIGMDYSATEALAEDRPANITGIIHDGEFDWLLTTDNTAHKVPAGTTDLSDATTVVAYEDDMEYEPEEGSEDA